MKANCVLSAQYCSFNCCKLLKPRALPGRVFTGQKFQIRIVLVANHLATGKTSHRNDHCNDKQWLEKKYAEGRQRVFVSFQSWNWTKHIDGGDIVRTIFCY